MLLIVCVPFSASIDHLVIPYNWEFVYPHVIIVIFLDASNVCMMVLKPDLVGNKNNFFVLHNFYWLFFILISCLMAFYIAVYFSDYTTEVACVVSTFHHPPL
jgi:hypothetical protein